MTPCNTVQHRDTFIRYKCRTCHTANINFVCSTCSQTFTRRWRGSVHNENFHAGRAEIVRSIDYVIGRTVGRYLPGEPPTRRRKKGLEDPTENKLPILEKKMGQKGDFNSNTNSASLTSQRYNPTHSPSPPDSIQENEDAIIKMAELKKLWSRCFRPEDVEELLSGTYNYCIRKGDNHPLDNALESARKSVKLREAKDILGLP